MDDPMVAAARFTAVIAILFAHDPSPLEANTPMGLQTTRSNDENGYSQDREKIRKNIIVNLFK